MAAEFLTLNEVSDYGSRLVLIGHRETTIFQSLLPKSGSGPLSKGRLAAKTIHRCRKPIARATVDLILALPGLSRLASHTACVEGDGEGMEADGSDKASFSTKNQGGGICQSGTFEDPGKDA